MLASKYTALNEDYTSAFLVPAEIVADTERFRAQGREALTVLYALNRVISGSPVAPCLEIIVFNHEERP